MAIFCLAAGALGLWAYLGPLPRDSNHGGLRLFLVLTALTLSLASASLVWGQDSNRRSAGTALLYAMVAVVPSFGIPILFHLDITSPIPIYLVISISAGFLTDFRRRKRELPEGQRPL